MRWHLAMLSLTLIAIIALLNQSSQSNSLQNRNSPSLRSNVELMDQQKRAMVGGYSSIDPKQANDLSSIADFALNEFVAQQSEAASASFAVLPSQIESGEVTPIILVAQQQVVAGMNYKLTIGLIQNNDCLGGFKVTVWKQLSGELKATNWGDVMNCKVIEEQFGDVMNALKVEGEMEGEKVEVEPDE
jgi:hypothetical protein